MYVVEPMKRTTANNFVSARSDQAQKIVGMLTSQSGDREQDERHIAIHGVVRALVGGLASSGAAQNTATNESAHRDAR